MLLMGHHIAYCYYISQASPTILGYLVNFTCFTLKYVAVCCRQHQGTAQA
jgi:hypothetical protein